MRRLVPTAAIVLAGLSAGYAQRMHNAGTSALMAPANPNVPPSLTPDARLVGSAPLPPHHQLTRADVGPRQGLSRPPDPEDARVDRTIEGICRGC